MLLSTNLFHQPIPSLARCERGLLHLTLYVWSSETPSAWVRIAPDNEERLVAMEVQSSASDHFCLTATVPLDRVRPHTAYAFKVQPEPGRLCWLAADGEHPRTPGQQLHFKWVHEAPPEWVKNQVFYQVFPDRFRCGDPSLNVADGAYHYLGERPVRARAWGDEPQACDGANEFFHGDLPGVVQALPYLQDVLGVTALYLNPVFRSDSNHKYDTIDFKQVDPTLGGEQALIELRTETKQRGMRLLLDGVLNHTSVLHDWFIRAQAGEAPYHEYYLINDDGSYISWKGHDSLPVLDYSSPHVVEEAYAGEDAVLRHWLREPYAIDGWRLDVIHMLGEGEGARNNAHHVAAMRQVIKSENPEAYLLGEHFFEATDWLQGDQEDAAMNYYGFLHPLWLFLAGRDLSRDRGTLSGTDMAAWMREARAKIPFALAQCQFNLLDSHDTPRLLTLLEGNERRLAMAVRLQMAYLGVPCVYYGDEIGMTGGEDPGCRGAFPWDETRWNTGMLETFRTAIAWRRRWPVLVNGGLVDLEAGDDYWAFARIAENGTALCLVNRSSTALTLDIPLARLWHARDEWEHADTGALTTAVDGRVRLTVGPESTELWLTSVP